MADSLQALLSFPPEKHLSAQEYHKQATAYSQSLQNVPPSGWTKVVEKKSLLELLDPALNSLPYLYCLLEHTTTVGKDTKRTEELLSQVLIFFAGFDKVQVSYAGTQWRDLFCWTIETFRSLGTTNLSPLSAALLRLDPSAGTFTTMHLLFVRLCLETGGPSQALPIIDKNLYAFPQTLPKVVPDELASEEHEFSNAYITSKSGFSHKIHPEFVLEYYLLGAHVYIGRRNWKRARLFLEYVILYPSIHHATSALQIEAYKKWILVGLLAEGHPFSYPRTADQQVMKVFKSLAKSYEALADSFEKRDRNKFQAEQDVGTQVWTEDGNIRLVHEAGTALIKYRVADLQRTYAALPLSRVASHLDLPVDQTAQTIMQMIQQRQLNADIVLGGGDASDPAVLRFHPTEPSAASPDADLEVQTKRIEEVIGFVRDADRRLQLTKEFADVSRRAKRAGAESELADQMDLDWNASSGPITVGDFEADEDIMA